MESERLDSIGDRLDLPGPGGDWLAVVADRCDAQLQHARSLREALVVGPPEDAAVLDTWNALSLGLLNAYTTAMTLRTVHPDAVVRERAAAAEVEWAELFAEVHADPGVLSVLSGVDRAGLDAPARRVLDLAFMELRRGGAKLGAAERSRIRQITARLAELAIEYQRNYTGDVRTVHVPVAELDGVPEEVRARFTVVDGRAGVPGFYSNLVVASSCRVRSTRQAVAEAFWSAGWPANEAVLAEILRLRNERARLVGHDGAAAYDDETKTLSTPQAVTEFLDAAWQLTRPLFEEEVAAVLAERRRADPNAVSVSPSDVQFHLGEIRRDRGADAREVGRYFRFERVKAGLLRTMSRLLALEFVPRPDVGRWHPSVEVFDVMDGGRQVGRFHLDLAPREGKDAWPQHLALSRGVSGVQLPESVLAASIPEGAMDHDSVKMLFHEFGHVLHSILSGQQHWARFSGVANERDFIEAPSTLLEDLVLEPAVIDDFAVDDDGNTIPQELLAALADTAAIGRGYFMARQIQLSRLALALHDDPPPDLDDVVERVATQLDDPVDRHESRNMLGSWMHVADDRYASAYYSYVVSLAISRDLLSGFGELLGASTWQRYRQTVLAPGSSKPARELVADFLGRPLGLDGLGRWLESGHQALREHTA